MVDNPGSSLRWKWIHGFFGALILAVSSIPGSDLSGAPIPVSDKVLHFGEYGFFGFLGGLAYFSTRRRFWILLLFGAGFAGLDEYWQSFVPGRHSELADFVFDLAGHVCGVLTGSLVAKRFR